MTTEHKGSWLELRQLLLLAVVVAAGAILVIASGVFLLAFAGILMAIVLRDPSDWLARHTPLSSAWTLPLVVLVVLGLFALLGWHAAPRLVDQAASFAERLPAALAGVESLIAQRLGDSVSFDARSALPDAGRLLGMLPNIVTMTFGALGSMIVVLAVGIYLAAQPDVYRDAVVRLFRPDVRDEAGETLDRMGLMLSRWMRGQLLSMVLVGLLSYAGLSLLGVPLALTLAVITGLLEFVPYLGALVAAVPVVLVASTESWSLAVYALMVYTAIQSLEGNLVIPLIQRQAVRVPPAVILLAQVLMGVLFGVIGIVLATPITAAVAVLVRRQYIDRVLEGEARPG